MDRERIETLLDDFKAAVARRVRAEVDAGACRTDSDFRRLHRAIENEDEVRERVLDTLAGALAG
jgi:hypothetical protein